MMYKPVHHATHRHDLDSVLYGRVLVLAPQNQHCSAAAWVRRTSQGAFQAAGGIERSQQSSLHLGLGQRHSIAPAPGSPAASESGWALPVLCMPTKTISIYKTKNKKLVMIHKDNYDDSNSNKDKDLKMYTAVQAVAASCQSPAPKQQPQPSQNAQATELAAC